MKPTEVLDILRRSMLVDGLPIVVDLDKSRGGSLRDARDGKEYVDLHGCFATSPLGWNHPALHTPEAERALLKAAIANPSNADFYTVEMGEFVETLGRTAQPPELPHLFLIAGGALAVENALKTAFDWKVRKNLARGRGEKGSAVIHFREAFHGRSGYTLSLTNSAAVHKVAYFPKFDWPRIPNPKLTFPLTPERLKAVQAAEADALAAIRAACDRLGDDVAACIIEPVQAEGGDNHFRAEFLAELRKLADAREFLLIFDEVQTGCGTSGKWWAWQHYGVKPDVLAFGKKMQVCGILAGPRVDEVDSVFKVPGRINSTWGGNLVDMVRARYILQAIHDGKLLENATARGAQLVAGLAKADGKKGFLSNFRGLGLIVAADCPDKAKRDALVAAGRAAGVLIIGCGEHSIRCRPSLAITAAEVDRGLEILAKVIAAQ